MEGARAIGYVRRMQAGKRASALYAGGMLSQDCSARQYDLVLFWIIPANGIEDRLSAYECCMRLRVSTRGTESKFEAC